MSGTVIHRVSRKRHRCRPPGWLARRRLDLDYGSIWHCECGERWQWSAPWGHSEWVSEGYCDALDIAEQRVRGFADEVTK